MARHAVERDQDGALDLVEYCEVTTQPDVCAFDAQETAAQPLARDVSMRELLAFSGPAVALYLNSPLLSLIDSAAVGRGAALTAGGTLELAALGPATAVADSVFAMFTFLSVATTTTMARARARGGDDAAAVAEREAATRQVATNALTISTAFGCLAAVALAALAPRIAALYCTRADGGAAALARHAARYIRVRAYGFPFSLATLAAQAACLGAQDAVSPLVAVVAGGAVNMALDFVLVVRPLHTGAVGAAWATVAAQSVAATLLVRRLVRKRFVTRASLRRWPRRAELWEFLRFGPFFFVLLMKLLLYNSATVLITGIGSAALAAHQVMFAAFMFCAAFADMLASTCQAFLPAYVDADSGELRMRDARPTLNRILALTAGVALLTNGIIRAVPRAGALFTDDLIVRKLMRSIEGVIGCCLLAHGSCVTLEGVLLVKRDLAFLVASYGVGGLIVAWVARALARAGPTLGNVWMMLTVYQFARAALFAARVFWRRSAAESPGP